MYHLKVPVPDGTQYQAQDSIIMWTRGYSDSQDNKKTFSYPPNTFIKLP